MKIQAVIVTYANRGEFLSQCIKSLYEAGVVDLVVVDNRADYDVPAILSKCIGLKYDVIHLEKNQGSAVGYNVGMQKVMQGDADFIFLLDDDNVVLPGAIAHLQDVWQSKKEEYNSNLLMIGATRPAHVKSTDPTGKGQSHDSFLGFDRRDIYLKIIKNIFGKERWHSFCHEEVRRVDFAPYSGLFFSRNLLNVVGLPNKEFVLYADDTEFTYRVTQNGGAIFLTGKPFVNDLEESWNVGDEYSNSFRRWLFGGSDIRVFYSVRNHVYFEIFSRKPKNQFSRMLNKLIYMAMLNFFSMFWGKRQRYRLICEAVALGEAGKLGLHDKYRIQ